MARQISLTVGVQAAPVTLSLSPTDSAGMTDTVVRTVQKKTTDTLGLSDSVSLSLGAPTGIFGDPGAGFVYFGIDVGANDNQPSPGAGVAVRESYYGRRMGCLRSYWNWGQLNSAVSRASTDLAAGRVPLLSIKVDALGGSNSGWDVFAAGGGDGNFIGFLDDLKALNKGPILVCIHHEPNNGDPGTSAMYLAMYRHAMALKGSNYPRILIVGGMLADSFFFSDQQSPALNIGAWIQPDSCDLPGLDFYHPDDAGAGTSPPDSSYKTFAASFNTTQSQLSTIYGGLGNMPPMVIGEWGCHTWVPHTSLTTAYMQDFYDWMLTYGYAMAYFDAVGTLWTTLDQQGKTNSGSSFDGETGPPWVRLDKFGSLLGLSSSKVIPLGGMT